MLCLKRKHIITFWGRRIHNQTAWRWILIKRVSKKGGNLDSAVVIRLIRDEKDIEATWPLYLSFHKESRYKTYPPKPPKKQDGWKLFATHFLQNPKQYGMFIAEINGKPIGFLHCVMSPVAIYQISVIFGFGILCVAILSGYLARRACRIEIVACLSCWAKQRQAVEIQVHVTHGFNLKKIHRFFKKLGFQMVGANYSMEI